MSKILVVDDEATVREAFKELLEAEGHQVLTARTAEIALESVNEERPELVILDVCMPGINGLQALERLKRSHAKLPVIVMTGRGTMETAIEATKRGAFDYQLKPFEPEEMLRQVARALKGARIMEQVALDSEPNSASATADAIVGHSAGMQTLFKAIGRVAPTDATVLIRGESGTGKELVARALYQHSRREAAPLHVVNCVAIPETLLEAELFGHERGAFTGAQSRRIGKLEQADGGTLFLDEIGDIPLSVQAKLLRTLQQKTLQRIGSNETVHVDVRILAATNRDLEKAMAAGLFREDLYHRLNVVSIRIPPLRERRDDIGRLTDYFLDRFAAELGVARPPLSAEATALLADYPWPGNIRELEHCIHRTLIFSGGHPVQADNIRQAMKGSGEAAETPAESENAFRQLACHILDTSPHERVYERFTESAERALLGEALRRSRGNQVRAARLLGLPRPTLHAKLQRLGIRAEEQNGY